MCEVRVFAWESKKMSKNFHKWSSDHDLNVLIIMTFEYTYRVIGVV